MRQYNDLKKMMDVAAGRRKASLVLKGGTIVNVFTERTEVGDIAIEDGCIAGIGEYDGLINADMTGGSFLARSRRTIFIYCVQESPVCLEKYLVK